MAALQDVGSLAAVTGEQCPVSSELPHTQLQLASDPFWDPGRGQMRWERGLQEGRLWGRRRGKGKGWRPVPSRERLRGKASSCLERPLGLHTWGFSVALASAQARP